jgi:hypothetical protein
MLFGALVMASFVVGLFFFRFWRDTRDRLFVWFGLAFWVLAGNWLGLGLTAAAEETRTYFYLLRLVAFTLILLGIVDKNRTASRPRPAEPGRYDRAPR